MKESSLHRSARDWAYREHEGKIKICKMTTLANYGEAGWPDWLVCLKGGHAFFVELKSPGGECTDLQLARHAELRALGFNVYVADNLNSIKGIFHTEIRRKR